VDVIVRADVFIATMAHEHRAGNQLEGVAMPAITETT
jgi:hypothetical protein